MTRVQRANACTSYPRAYPTGQRRYAVESGEAEISGDAKAIIKAMDTGWIMRGFKLAIGASLWGLWLALAAFAIRVFLAT